MRDENVPPRLARAGEKIKEGWKKAAEEHGLRIKIDGIPHLPKFSLVYDNEAEIPALFTQEMLERGFLARNSVYVSFAHEDVRIREYLSSVDEVFGLLVKGIERKEINKMLKGPAAMRGFARLA